MDNKISGKVTSRLTLYHSILCEYIEDGIELISSPQIASRLGIDDSQVRKDFGLLKNVGRCRVGYNVKELKDKIEKTLGLLIRRMPLLSAQDTSGLRLQNMIILAATGLI